MPFSYVFDDETESNQSEEENEEQPVEAHSAPTTPARRRRQKVFFLFFLNSFIFCIKSFRVSISYLRLMSLDKNLINVFKCFLFV